MRARGLKPGLFKNEILGAADPLLTILFQGLWCMADRDGRLEDRPLRIKAEVFPYRECAVSDLLDWLAVNSFIVRYEIDGDKFISINNFVKHQNPHKREAASTIPAPVAGKAKPRKGPAKARPRPVQGEDEAQPDPEPARLTPDSPFSDSGLLTPDSPSLGLAPERSDAETVFDHWRKTWGHEKAHLDAKRRKVLQGALTAYSVADLCRAITGYRNSPHHTGQNDRATVYDDIGLLLRDAAHIDAGLRFADNPPRAEQSELTRRNVAAIESWVPPELRRVAN